jgi:hypothetical protein
MGKDFGGITAKTGGLVLAVFGWVTMKPDQRDRIRKALDMAATKVSGMDLERSMAKGQEFFALLANLTALVKTREQLTEMFDNLPDLTFKEEALIRVGCRFAPHLLRLGLTAAAETAKKKLPQVPGGRSRALSREEENQVCRLIGELLIYGTSLKDAIFRASQRFDVSRRTIERVWAQRLHLSEDNFEPTFPEVVSALRESLKETEQSPIEESRGDHE